MPRLTIPKRLRLHTRFDRKLLGKLCACAGPASRPKAAASSAATTWCPAPACRQTGGRRHSHIRRTTAPAFHVLLTRGAFTAQGEFLELAELDLERLETAWQEAVFALYLAEDKIEPEVVENPRTWPHSDPVIPFTRRA